MKIKLPIIGIMVLIVIIFAVIIFITAPWFTLFTGIQLLPNPPKPVVTYGEFPFRLEYEVNGRRIIDEDILICEFDGFATNTAKGKYRKWKERLASGREKIILYENSENDYIYYSPGYANYYMDDMDEYVTFNHYFPNACYYKVDGTGLAIDGIISAKKLEEDYKIVLISWMPSEPIINSFKM